eukprot:CAMPEP_0177667652 /NCGR_PEP_ID=MMETSP0447-20121125/22243_1 /TAXON_ID=0 /ORGANISM="Stygamoeba regulata, Strain BSH-02190019" /LENGTH=130 /DNA_ID=CAMNT_0019173909 /DNA_START=141 /DNA_END=530 /DNA_ORIENTATION=-
MVTGKKLLDGFPDVSQDDTPIQLAIRIWTEKLRPVIPKSCPPALAQLIRRCWSHSPQKRPTFDAITTELENLSLSFDQLRQDPTRCFGNPFGESRTITHPFMESDELPPHGGPASIDVPNADTASSTPTT